MLTGFFGWSKIFTILPMYRVSPKKYGAVDYQYFKNGNTQQCKIYRHDKYIFRLVVCEILAIYVKCNKSYELEKNDGSNGT